MAKSKDYSSNYTRKLVQLLQLSHSQARVIIEIITLASSCDYSYNLTLRHLITVYNIQTPDNSGGIKTAQPAHTCQVYCIHDTPFNYIGLVNSRKICGIISRKWSIYLIKNRYFICILSNIVYSRKICGIICEYHAYWYLINISKHDIFQIIPQILRA